MDGGWIGGMNQMKRVCGDESNEKGVWRYVSHGMGWNGMK